MAAELIMFWFKKLDFDTVLKALDLLGTRYGRPFDLDYIFDGKLYTLFIRHDRGMKHSLYYEEAAKGSVRKIGKQTRNIYDRKPGNSDLSCPRSVSLRILTIY